MMNEEVKLSDLVSAVVVDAQSVSDGSGSYALYVVEVTCRQNGESWRVHRRFSAFLKLQSDLSFLAIPISLHAGIFASSTSPQTIERRKRILEEFLGAVLSFSPTEALSGGHLGEFLRMSDEVLVHLGLSPNESEDSVPSLCQSPTPPIEDSRILDWLEALICTVGRDMQLLTREVCKLGDDKLRDVLIFLLDRIGESLDGVPTVVAADALGILSHLVSVETNQEAGIVVHCLLQLSDWAPKAGLAKFVLYPTTGGTRLHAFRVAAASRLSPGTVFSSEAAVAQFQAWQQVQSSTMLSVHNDSMEAVGAQSGLAALFAIGPNSPVARSVQGSAQGGRQGAAQEARDWVSFAAATARNSAFVISGCVQDDDGWKSVRIPSISEAAIVGKVAVKYRLAGTGLYELNIEWKLPSSTDMEAVINCIWDLAPSEGAPVATSDESLTETAEYVWNDARRVGGTAVVSLIKSCSRSWDEKILLAATTDPRAGGSQDPLVRHIRHLHYIGCEIDVDSGNVTGCALLSSESIFLIAGDLLGERLLMWRTLEHISHQLLMGSSQTSSGISRWLTSSRSRPTLVV